MPNIHIISRRKPKESAELDLYTEAAWWALDKFAFMPGQIREIYLYVDEYRINSTISVADGCVSGDGCSKAVSTSGTSLDEKDALGFFSPDLREIHLATRWANSPAQCDLHTSPMDVCLTLFHEVGHSIQKVVGSLEGAPASDISETLIEIGAEEFASRALGEFLIDRFFRVAELLPNISKRSRPPRRSK